MSTWTSEDSSSSAGTTGSKADESMGWERLCERKVGHPSDLLGYAEIGSHITLVCGPDTALVLPILTGSDRPGRRAMADRPIPHPAPSTCASTEEAIIPALINARHLYLAWKPGGSKNVVRQPAQDWPLKAKADHPFGLGC